MKGGFGAKPAGGFGAKSVGTKQPTKPLITTPNYVLNKNPSAALVTSPNHVPSINLAYPNMKAVHGDPPVFEIDNVFTTEVCDSYISRAETLGLKVQSQTFDSNSGSKRTSTTWYMPYKEVPELIELATKLTGLPSSQFEEPQIVRYEMGQQFSWHYDAIPTSQNNNGGNRLATLLVYLNTLPLSSGGATCFKDLNIQIKPEQGKALLFFPCFANGSPDDRTMHSGQICSDTKWIAQIWIHESDYQSKLRE